ncbi:MAG: hypothetical protein OXC40_02385 [Proteobacteria bacterium]|nr:hypothetical protein [Pseudomonadota bacterium]
MTLHNSLLLLRMSFILGFMAVFPGCGELDTLRDAAESTKEMNKKMDEILAEVQRSNDTTESMSEKMDTVEENMEVMKKRVDQVSGKMGVIDDNMKTTVGYMKSMDSHMVGMTGVIGHLHNLMITMDSNMKHIVTTMDTYLPFTRQFFAKVSRDLAWSKLVNEQRKIETKLLDAAVYYYSFEFQMLTAEEYNDPQKMSEQFYEATREYFRQVEPLIRLAKGHLAIDSKNNDRNVLYALGAALHEYNPGQKDHYAEPITMEKLLKYGLLSHKLAVEQQASFSREVQTWLNSALFLLKLRHNFITGVILQKISDLDQVAGYQFNFSEKSSQTQKLLRPWTMEYATLTNNPALVAELSKFIFMANDLRTFLFCLEGDPDKSPEIAPFLGLIMKKLDLESTTPFTSVFRESTTVPQNVAEDFIKAIFALKQSVAGRSYKLEQCPDTQVALDNLRLPAVDLVHY